MENHNKKKKIKNVLLGILILVALVLIIPYSRTLAATELYSIANKQASPLSENNMEINIPSGKITEEKDWFNNMVWFHDETYRNSNVDITVLYSYGAFNNILGTSSYYDQNSQYYGSFYGGYFIINNNDDKFGYKEDNSLDVAEIMSITEHDQKNLVLPALGCERDKRVFEVNDVNGMKTVSYIGYDDWITVDSKIITNGPAHEKNDFYRGYFQYGLPLEPIKGSYDFEPKEFYGRIYVRYFEEYKATVCLYIMSYDEDVMNITDSEILSKSKIK